MNIGLNYTRWLYALVVLLTIIAALYLSGWIYGALRAIGDILTLYFTAWLLQLFFTPLVDAAARRGVPRIVGVSCVYLLLTVLIGVVLVRAVPSVYYQGQTAVAQLGNQRTYNFITGTTQGIEKFLIQHGVPRKDIDRFTRDYSVSLRAGAPKAGQRLQDIIRGYADPKTLANSTTSFFGFINTLQTLLINFVLVLILAFYMTLDGHTLVRRALSYFPPAVSEVMAGVHVIVNRKFGGYLRGQIILAMSYGLLTYIIGLGFRLQYAALIAVLAAIMMLIPYVGAIAAVALPLAAYVLAHVADVSFPTGRLVLLFVFLFVAQHVVLNLLAPRVMSSAVGMHPILVILGLLLGTKVAGLWGAIFGVPIFGILLDTVDLVYRRVMDRRYGFQPPPAVEVDAHGDTAAQHEPPSTLDGHADDGAPGEEAARGARREPSALQRTGAALRSGAAPRETRS